MRVLHVISSLRFGGAEKLLEDSLSIYQKYGIDVDLLLLKKSEVGFEESLEKQGFVIQSLTQGSIYNPLLIFKLMTYIRKYDIVHTHLFPTFYWVVLAKFFSFSTVRIVHTEHNTENKRHKYLFTRIIDKVIYSKIRGIGCISEGVYNSLSSYLNNSKKLQQINNGIILDRFDNNSIREKVKAYNFFLEKDFVLIQVSSFKEQKDQSTLIRSLKLLPDNVKLLLVGDGKLREKCEFLVENLELQERILFLGNRVDIPELLNYSDVVVLSSHWEGFGLVVVEGMACGKPVIASNVDGVSEIVSDYGLLFEKQNEKDLADQVMKLMNIDKYKTTAKLCKDRSLDYSIDKMVLDYIKFYKRCLSKT